MTTRTRKATIADLDAHTVTVMRDKIQDTEGELMSWLAPVDFMVGCGPLEQTAETGRNFGYWHNSTGGQTPRLAILRTGDATLHRAFAELVPIRWTIRAAQDFSWEPLPMFPYRLLWRVLAEFGIPDPDSYIKTGAHRLSRETRSALAVFACGAKDRPFVTAHLSDLQAEMIGRGYKCSLRAYRFFHAVAGWENRRLMLTRLRPADYETVSSMVCPYCKGQGVRVSDAYDLPKHEQCSMCRGVGKVKLDVSQY